MPGHARLQRLDIGPSFQTAGPERLIERLAGAKPPYPRCVVPEIEVARYSTTPSPRLVRAPNLTGRRMKPSNYCRVEGRSMNGQRVIRGWTDIQEMDTPEKFAKYVAFLKF
jgi:hypothetical protein